MILINCFQCYLLDLSDLSDLFNYPIIFSTIIFITSKNKRLNQMTFWSHHDTTLKNGKKKLKQAGSLLGHTSAKVPRK